MKEKKQMCKCRG